MKDYTKISKRLGKTAFRTPSGFIYRKLVEVKRAKQNLSLRTPVVIRHK